MKTDRKIEIEANLYAANRAYLQAEVDKVIDESEEGVDAIHVDFLEGSQLRRIYVDPQLLADIKVSAPLKLHLMTEGLIKILSKVKHLPIASITVDINYTSPPEILEVYNWAKKEKKKFGISLFPILEVPHNLFFSFLYLGLEDLDHVTVMMVKAERPQDGFQKEGLETIRTLKNLSWKNQQKVNFRIVAEGGITDENIRDVIKAGADTVVVSSYIFRNSEKLSPAEAVAKLRETIKKIK